MSDTEEYYDTQQVVSFNQLQQLSNSHYLFEDILLSQFAEGIDSALTEIISKDTDNFNRTLNVILEFVSKNIDNVKHFNYKNPKMFVIGYFCSDFKKNKINDKKLLEYSKKYNINDIIRYTTLILEMNNSESGSESEYESEYESESEY